MIYIAQSNLCFFFGPVCTMLLTGLSCCATGGRTDMAHHASNAYRALYDTLALSEAVQKAIEMTSKEDTLIMVTADHSHSLTMAGYRTWSDQIMGKLYSRSFTHPDNGRVPDIE